MKYKRFILDDFQEKAINSIDKNHSVVVFAPTGCGKTLIADYIINKDIKHNIRVIYTAPIKALSNQKYKDFCAEYGEEMVGLLTGDVVKNPSGKILVMTTEIYRNMALSQDSILENISYVIFDEIHFINDIERGYVWEESIIFSKNNIRFLCLSATIPNAHEFASWIESIKKHKVCVVSEDTRKIPLEKKFYDSELGICTLKDISDISDIPDYNYLVGKKRQRRPYVKPPHHIELIKEIKDKTPCLFFCFSRNRCENNAKELSKTELFKTNSSISSYVRTALSKAPKEINKLESVKILRKTLPYGIAFHHAGLLPIIKEIVENLFEKGLINVLYTTETFAVGINMPAKTVCFESLRKFDGINFRFLNSKEFFQIAGRAGRRGIDTKGFVYSMVHRRDFDYKQIKKFTDKDSDPIKSQFKLSVNTVLNLIDKHNKDEIETILKNNFFTFQKYGKDYKKIKQNIFLNRFLKTKKNLVKLNYIKDDNLTQKGQFSKNIYSDEILTGEIFATDFYEGLSEFQIVLLISCLIYEHRESTQIFEEFAENEVNSLTTKIKSNSYISKDLRFNNLSLLTGLIYPCYTSKTIFDVLDNTNLSEGDLIRFYRQVLDKINQISKAVNDVKLQDTLNSGKNLISNFLKGIDEIMSRTTG